MCEFESKLKLAHKSILPLGEKHIIKLLHFPNITPIEQKRLLKMSDSSSASDDEQEPHSEEIQKTQRKKSSTKRSLDLQRKLSLNKLKEERKESQQQNNNSNTNHVSDSSSSPSIESPSIAIRHGKCRLTRNGKISGGYEQYNLSLLHVPMPKDYGEPSSDDLSSEWDSDVPSDKTNGTANKESKVRNIFHALSC